MSSNTRNFISIKNKYDRVVLLVDMDCFYCQVEEKLNPEYAGKPLAVVQYNAWRGGGIIAVNYAARAKGVTRHMRGDEAKEQCPDIILAKVPNVREKADLSKYRDAGKEVANVLQKFTAVLERASVDEAYLDITEAVNKRMEQLNAGTFVLQPNELQHTYAVGYNNIGEFISEITKRYADPYANDEEYQCAYDVNDVPAVRKSDIRLLIGASICSEIRAAVKEVTGFECSAGIAHNKILAKYACGMNKPNKQTILPLSQIPILFETLPIGKITGLGAKFGEEVCERLNIRYVGQLLKFTEAELQRKFDEKNGTWLYYLGRGIDLEAVTPRFYSKSIGCCKKFPGRNNISGFNTLSHWLNELASEINERLEKDLNENNRRAKQMVVSFVQEFDGEDISSSRSAPLASYERDVIAKNSLDIIKANTKQFFRAGSTAALNNPIKFLGISVGKFETINNTQNKLQEMFANQVAKNQQKSNDESHSTALNDYSNISAEGASPSDVEKLENKKLNLLEKYLLPKENDTNCNIQSTIQNETKNNIIEPDSQVRGYNKILEEPVSVKKVDKLKETKSFFRKALKSLEIDVSAQPEETKAENAFKNIEDKNDDNIKMSEDLEDLKRNKQLKNSYFVNALKNKNIIVPENIENKQVDSVGIQPMEPCEDDIHSNDQIDVYSKANKRKHSEINENNTKCDYLTSYAEFAVPELNPELLQFTKCDICKVNILADKLSIQTHQDYHLAQDLNRQQREEYREEVKVKIKNAKTLPNTNKKTKNNPSSSTVHKRKTDITKFFSLCPSNTELLYLPSTSSAAATDEEGEKELSTCSVCKILVKSCDMDEHKDFHVAKDLQRKLNQLEVKTVSIIKKPSPSNQRKNLNSTLLNATNKSIVSKPINEFFTQPNY